MLEEKKIKPFFVQNFLDNLEVEAQAPSNIALIKYWGKQSNQIPANTSISFTLQKCISQTKLYFKKKVPLTQSLSLQVYFEGLLNEKFTEKVNQFFKKIESYCPYLTQYHIKIDTKNTFPHSSGIASSASGMAAIALGLLEVEKKLGANYTLNEALNRASFLARLGSGSASRSIYNGLILWGKHPELEYTSNYYACPLQGEIAPIFKHFYDTILIVHKGQKVVSSTAGHNLMHQHSYATQRFTQANMRITEIIELIKEGNLTAFISLVESEALTLHAMMMTSKPYYILMQPNTLAIIQTIWNYRKAHDIPVFFTLDAGANVHVLYPASVKQTVNSFIEKALKPFCENGLYIQDEINFL